MDVSRNAIILSLLSFFFPLPLLPQGTFRVYHLFLFTDAVILAKEKVDSPLKVKAAGPLAGMSLEMAKNSAKFVLELNDGQRVFKVCLRGWRCV